MAETFRRRPYSDYPFLIITNHPYRIKLGNLRQTLRVFVHQKDNLFGDSNPLDLAGLTITFNLYNSDNVLVASGPAYVSDVNESEIEYTWSNFDLKETGVFNGEFLFKDIDDTTFILPERDRIQIVVF